MQQGGGHDNVTYDLQFNCVAYRSTLITSIANDLLKQYQIVANSLNFNPELGDAVYAPNNVGLFNRALGLVPADSATGTGLGNLPAYHQAANARTRVRGNVDVNDGKLAGQPGRGATQSDEGFSGTGSIGGAGLNPKK
jgi:hypothetical protein